MSTEMRVYELRKLLSTAPPAAMINADMVIAVMEKAVAVKGEPQFKKATPSAAQVRPPKQRPVKLPAPAPIEIQQALTDDDVADVLETVQDWGFAGASLAQLQAENPNVLVDDAVARLVADGAVDQLIHCGVTYYIAH